MYDFFVTDQFKHGEIKVAYCPTENMLADFFTKPLQGAAFWKMAHTYLICPPLTMSVDCTRANDNKNMWIRNNREK